MNTLPDISKSKDNHAMKFGQLINITLEIFFCKNHVENEAVRLVFVFKKIFLKKLL